MSYLQDKEFMIALQTQQIKQQNVKIVVYDKQQSDNLTLYKNMLYNDLNASNREVIKDTLENMVDLPIYELQGKVTQAPSISIDGSSLLRRAGSLSLIVERTDNDLQELQTVLCLNKKIKIFVGIENNINNKYDKICWIPVGVFVITQIQFQHTNSDLSINLSFKDKMALLNGECGGTFPAAITFGDVEVKIEAKEIEYTGEVPYPKEPQENVLYVFNEGGNKTYKMWSALDGWTDSDQSKEGEIVKVSQRIYDIIKTCVVWYGNETPSNLIINDVPLIAKTTVRYIGSSEIYFNTMSRQFSRDSSVLTSGSTWLTINYNEDCGYMFTDFTYAGELAANAGDSVVSVLEKIIEQLGNFECFYDVEGRFVFQERKNYLNKAFTNTDELFDKKAIIDNNNYLADFSNNTQTSFSFKDSNLIQSFSNTPKFSDIKNDFHVWGKLTESSYLHYHLAIKKKPELPYRERQVVYEVDDRGEYTGKLRLAKDIDTDVDNYAPVDWRAELYLQGLENKAIGVRPDQYQNELLDLFDNIYNMKEKEFKSDKVNNPNGLLYFIDYIEPLDGLEDISVDSLGSRIKTISRDDIKKIYDSNLQEDIILIGENESLEQQARLIKKCVTEGYTYSRVPTDIAREMAIGTNGYSAESVLRQELFNITSEQNAISINCIPLYNLEPNTKIEVYDKDSKISGEFMITSLNVPLNGQSTMTISASKINSKN